jgi:hypothetical protein
MRRRRRYEAGTGWVHDHAQREQRHVKVRLPLATTATSSSQPQRGQSGVRSRCLRRSGFGIKRTVASSSDLWTPLCALSGSKSGDASMSEATAAVEQALGQMAANSTWNTAFGGGHWSSQRPALA